MMRERYKVPIIDAQKVKKQQNIEYFNSSLVAGKVRLLMPNCSAYAKELMDLQKEFRKSTEREEGRVKLGEWKEHPKQPNDLCDCGLYIHRECRSYLHTEPKPKVKYGTPEYYEQLEQKLAKQAEQKSKGQEPWWRQT